MTKEEAMYLLNNLRSVAEGKEDEAIDTAIEALSDTDRPKVVGIDYSPYRIQTTAPSDETHDIHTETHGVCSDLISRDDAIKSVGDWMQKEYGYLDLNRAERLIDALSTLPSAEAVQGKKSGSKLDVISRELAMERIANDNVVGGMERINEYNNSKEYNEYLEGISDAITTIFCDVPSADAVSKYTEWLEKIIVEMEPTFLCEEPSNPEWCYKNCKYTSIQSECLRQSYIRRR